jgi:hypothetical protein
MTQRGGQNANGAESASPSDRPPASLVAARMLAPVVILAVFALLVAEVIPVSLWTWAATGVLLAAFAAAASEGRGAWTTASAPRKVFASTSLLLVLVLYYYLLSRLLATEDDWGFAPILALLLVGAVALGFGLGIPRVRRSWLGEPGEVKEDLTGILGPYAWLAVLIAIMTSVFASVTLFAAEKDIISLTAAGADLPSFERIAQQYVWQFCKSVPLLDITQTLRWNVPFVYPDAGTGTLVLLYKLAVIIPLIGAFLDYWRQQTE